MNKKKNVLIVVLFLLLAVTIGFSAYTYSKYVSELNDKSGSAVVAKWDFVNDNQNTTLVPLMATYNAATLVNGKIAPGTEGSFSITLVNTNTDVGVNYSIKIGTIQNKPTNLKFYSDNTYTTEMTVGSTEMTGSLSPNDSTGVTKTIYWKWAYNTTEGDTADTTDGAAAATLTIPVQISGTQVQPTVSS